MPVIAMFGKSFVTYYKHDGELKKKMMKRIRLIKVGYEEHLFYTCDR